MDFAKWVIYLILFHVDHINTVNHNFLLNNEINLGFNYKVKSFDQIQKIHMIPFSLTLASLSSSILDL